MNDAISYENMIEVPVKTCSVTVAPSKKRKGAKKKPEELKTAVIKKVNDLDYYNEYLSEVKKQKEPNLSSDTGDYDALINKLKNQISDSVSEDFTIAKENSSSDIVLDNITEEELSAPDENLKVNTITVKTRSQKKSFKKEIIAIISVVAVFAVAVTSSIFLAERFSIPTLFSGLFNDEEAVTLVYSDFDATVPCLTSGEVSLSDGVMTITGKGAVYSTANGTVSDIVFGEDGKYSMTILHGENFKTVISGLDYTFSNVGDSVYKNIPVGQFMGDGSYTVSMYSNSGLITDYSLEGDSIVWLENETGAVS